MGIAVTMRFAVHPKFPSYEVSEFGDIYALRQDGRRGRRLAGTIDRDGYIRHHLRDADGLSHMVICQRIVLETFVGAAPSEKHEAAHLNGSRTANHFSNLEWKLPVGNHADRVVHGTAPKGVNNGRAKIVEDDVRRIRTICASAATRTEHPAIIDELAAEYGVHWATIYSISTRRSWSHV